VSLQREGREGREKDGRKKGGSNEKMIWSSFRMP